MNLERPGQKAIRESTKIPVAGATPHQARTNKRLALAVYAARMGDLARHRHELDAPPTVITFTTYAAWYLEHHTAHKRSAKRERSAMGHLKAWFGTRPLHTIDAAAVVEWRTARVRVVKAATVNRELDVLKHMLTVAVPKYLRRTPIARLPRLYAPRPPIRILTEAEEDRILAAATPDERVVVLLGLDALLRMGDIRRLQWAHDHGTFLDIVQPKVQPYRVPVTPRLREALTALPHPSPYVLPRLKRGEGPRSPAHVHEMFVDLCTRADVCVGRKHGGVTFHGLRHTGASRALERGASIRAVQDLGGWQSLKQLQRYAHPSWKAIEAAAASIGARPVPTAPKAPKEPESGQ